MPSTYTSSLRLTLPATGENPGTWGTLVNTGITSLVDASIAGRATISTWGGAGVAYTLSNSNGVSDEARQMFINATGSPGEAKDVICPAVSKMYVFTNATTGGFALTLKTPSGSGVAVPAGQTMFLRCDGTDVLEAYSYRAATTIGTLTLSNPLAIASGGTGLTSAGTANYVLQSNGTSFVMGPVPSTGAVTSFSAGTTGLTPSTGSTGNITLAGTLAIANGGTGQITANAALNALLPSQTSNATKYLTTDGTNTSWAPAGSLTLNVVTGTTQTAAANNHYVLTNVAATTVTLPATPSAGDIIWVTVGNGLTTNVLARNGNNIQSIAEDCTLNSNYAAVQLRYINSTIGWTFV